MTAQQTILTVRTIEGASFPIIVANREEGEKQARRLKNKLRAKMIDYAIRVVGHAVPVRS